MSAHRDQERRALDLYGLSPSSAHACPYVVLGRRCRAGSDTAPCVCQRHGHALDHGRVWLAKGGGYVLTGEPYTMSGDELRDLVADLAELGLQVIVTGRALWNPGATVMLLISPIG